MRKLLYSAILLIGCLTAVIMVSGCMNKNPLGGDYQIRVVADSSIWQQTEPILGEIFERIEYTPRPEKEYELIKANLNNYKRFKNILFISTLDANDEISKSINSSVSEEVREKIEAGNIIFIKKNVWVNYQMIMFLIGKDLPSLLNRIDEQRSEIFFQFNEYWNKFHENILYKNKEQFDVEKHLLETYGWMVRVPLDYKLEVQSARDRFVMFHRTLPLRWFAVYWIEATNPLIITKDWCIAKRNEIGKKFYENEEVEQKYQDVIAEQVIFLNRRALELKGLWKDEEKVAGGPFWMYCFFDEPTERIYFIDFHLFLPEFRRSKLHYLKQMDIIAHTFKTILEIKPDEIGRK
jgi:hypothetical protein